MREGIDSRRAAASGLGRVLRDGAYADLLAREFRDELDPGDARLAHRMFFDALRHLRRVDRIIETAAGRPLEDVDPPVVLDVLRIAVTELVVLERAPHAAVSTAVDVVRTEGAARATGFANAVLRRVTRGGEPDLPAGPAGTAIRLGVPDWILERLVAAWGADEAAAFLAASNGDASATVRLRRGRPAPGWEPVAGIDDAYSVPDPDAAVTDGAAVVMDAASIAVGQSVDAHPGMASADLAAAPGGKTLHLWDAQHGDGLILAADLHRRRLGTARRRLRRLGARPHWIVMDARRPALHPGRFDRVLVDAPCTGLGTLRRRPEIRHRLDADSPKRMGALQRDMLDAAVELLAPGGRLVYSVCTVFPEETVDVVGGHGARPPDGLPGRRWGDGLLLTPDRTGTDGMFIAVIER